MIDWLALGVGIATTVGVPLAKGYAKRRAAQAIQELATGARKRIPPDLWEAAQGVLEERAASKAAAEKAAFEAQIAELKERAERAEQIARGLTLPPPLVEIDAKRKAAIAKGKAALPKPRGRK